jgi:molybdate transport system ATP-binding protein
MIRVDARLRLGAFDLEIAFENDKGVIALFGRSGSGKSLTISLISGLARPDRGTITLDGRVLVDTATGVFVPKHRRRVGLVFQDAQLFPHFTVRQNLMFGRWFAPKLGRAIGFAPVVETLGIGHLLDRRPPRLSGGEKQRVAIGRALLSSPRILLFDEPLASLDEERKQEILPLIEHVRDEFAIPIVYVSHAIEEVARLAARVVMMENGRVAAIGAV